jgi:phosphoribosylanthranilate isomerase
MKQNSRLSMAQKAQGLVSSMPGGTRRTHNREVSRRIVKSVHVPVYLAGGIWSKNVVEAIKDVNPFGINLSSSVSTNNLLYEQKLEAFFKLSSKIIQSKYNEEE